MAVTSFFRDPEAFRVLEKEVIPVLRADRREAGILRLWIPGCSTGEEAYSLAILIAEYQEKLNKSFKVQIFATDIDSNAIVAARLGLFSASIADDITRERLSSFFKTEDNGKTYRIQKRIREMVIFSEQNIIDDPPFSRLDMISCRNLLIYMKRDLQKKIISLDELKIMKKHPERGYHIASATEEFAHVANAILHHHERWDGSGYPDGLKGEEIPLLSRIAAVVDAYDAMTNKRPYNQPKSHQEAIAELKRCAGSQFDPELVEVFLQLYEEDENSC